MRTFHLTWMAFFLCFFAWFGIAPLMPVIREELNLDRNQVGNMLIASVAATVFARLLMGWLCDRIGPRLTYTILLIGGSFPVMLIGLSDSYETLLLFRLAIGAIGAAFVITQFHTSAMFAPNVIGAANATTAGWGNLGGGVAQMVMPLLYTGLLALGLTGSSAWRWTMVVPGLALFIMGIVYYRSTRDTPAGNMRELQKDISRQEKRERNKAFLIALRDPRVWALFLIYGACFGVELTMNNVAALYFMDYFYLDMKTAGLIAGLFGLMNLFARSLGGLLGDRFGMQYGLQGRVYFMFAVLLAEGISLMLFSRISLLPLAVAGMVLFSLFVQMAEGATFAVVPFINKKATGSVSGIVGAGGNAGAVAAGFLFKSEQLSFPTALLIMGACVCLLSFSALAVRFSTGIQLQPVISQLPDYTIKSTFQDDESKTG
ncbi:MFS transporter [Anseongella ginsenosidimutans]|nr:MFS transporter [Anseongella ginsenosidimutans]